MITKSRRSICGYAFGNNISLSSVPAEAVCLGWEFHHMRLDGVVLSGACFQYVVPNHSTTSQVATKAVVIPPPKDCGSFTAEKHLCQQEQYVYDFFPTCPSSDSDYVMHVIVGKEENVSHAKRS